MFECDHEACDKKYTNKYLLKHHFEGVHEGRVYSCQICDKTCQFKSNLDLHMKTMHSAMQYPCDQCSHIAKSSPTLRYHKRHSHREKLFKCESCDFKATTKGRLNKHFHYKAFWYKYGCTNCGKQFSDSGKLGFHQKGICPGKKISFGDSFGCEECPFRAPNINRLREHKKRKHSKVMIPCDQCLFKSGLESDLKIHKARCHGLFTCVMCEFVTESELKFRIHILTKHKQPKLGRAKNYKKCDVCKIIPKTKAALQMHNFMKHSESDFASNASFKAHEKTCGLCGRLFKTDRSLSLHMTKGHDKSTEDDKMKKKITKAKTVSKEKVSLQSGQSRGDQIHLKIEELKIKYEGNTGEYFEIDAIEEKIEDEEDITISDKISNDDDSINLMEAKFEDWRNELSENTSEVTAGNAMFLCPVGSCIFSIRCGDLNIQENHFKQSHGNLGISDLHFLKL